jgi:hypothetical protein
LSLPYSELGSIFQALTIFPQNVSFFSRKSVRAQFPCGDSFQLI